MIAQRLKKDLNYYEAIAALVGTIIGAGVLGIPFVIAKVGFLIGALFMVVMAVLVVVLHLMLGEVVTATREPLQLVGLTRRYLGKGAGWIMGLAYVLSLNGVLLAYLVGVGDVFAAFVPGTAFMWSVIFFVLGSFVVVSGVAFAKHVSFVMTAVKVLVLLGIIILSVRGVAAEHVQTISWENIFLPFGVILFALSGISALPLVEIIDHKKREFKRVIVVGTLIAAVLYFFFALAVVAVTGSATTEVATIGLGQALGPLVLVFGNVFAFFAMGSSFILIGLALTGVYSFDYNVPRVPAALLACAVPFVLFVAGARQFVTILGLVGSLFIALEMFLIVLAFLRMRRTAPSASSRYIQHPRLWGYTLLTVFAIAGALGVWEWLSNI
ncbi:MAG TPA: hypothetical protein DDW36_00960 [Candidatus Magasanikbacteria bacterium]|nr:hypothetical protein [Candidatus Magasanikbacteria bacterium]